MSVTGFVIRRVLPLVLLFAAVGGGVVYFAVDRRPAIDREATFTPEHIERARRILKANNPRRMKAGEVHTVEITAADGDLALNYLARRYLGGSAETRFERGRMRVRASIRSDTLSFGPTSSPIVNVEAVVGGGDGLPKLEQLRVGQLPLPPSLAEGAIRTLIDSAWTNQDITALSGAIKSVEFDEKGARITYEWREGMAEVVRAALIPAEARERLRGYQTVLAEKVNAAQGRISLAELITPVFALAASRGAGADAVLENRAAIVVLTFYVDGRYLWSVVPEARAWPRPSRRQVTLNGRADLSKHFIISAALAANTGGPFADAVGLYKEVSDSKGGSGFSFVDLAADRAGTTLGARAEGRDTARALQARLGVPLVERDMMPETDGLPERMPEPEFKQRFGGIGAPAYGRMMRDIETRIASLPLYR